MPVDRLRRTGTARSRTRGKVVAVLLAAVWLVLLAVLGAHSVSAKPLQQAITADNSPTPTDTPLTNTPTTAPATPTSTHGRPPTATPTIGSTTPTVSGTTTATVEPTATTASGGTGGGNPNDPGSGSDQPTKVVLAQPTYGAVSDTSDQGISVASFGSNGLLLASLMSCIVGILGIVVAVIAVRILRRDGYGPFLRALLLGKRAANQPKSKSTVAASNAGNVRRAAWRTDDPDDYSGEGQSFSGYGTRAPPSGPGRRSPQGPKAPPSRSSRPNW